MDTSFAVQPSDTFVDGLKTLVTPGLITRASLVLGEQEIAVRRGLPAAVFTIFGTLVKYANDRSLMRQISDLIDDLSSGAATPAGPLNVSSTSRGVRFLTLLSARSAQPMYRVLAVYAGVSRDAASSLLGIAAPLALGYLSRIAHRESLDLAALTRLLLIECESVIDLVPDEISMALGFRAQHVPAGFRRVEWRAQKVVRLRWVIIVLIILAAAWGFTYLFDNTETGFITRSLPGGVLLRYAGDGVESKLLDFIENSNTGADKEVWFDFDRLLFEFDSAVLKADSATQLRNVAAILSVYPNVHIKIGGYTDDSGVPSSNVKLSEARARRVMQELTKLGISADRLSAEGYGANYSADQFGADKPKTRRVALRVTEK